MVMWVSGSDRGEGTVTGKGESWGLEAWVLASECVEILKHYHGSSAGERNSERRAKIQK